MAGIHHFLFLSDPRTLRVIGEPKAINHAVIALSEAVGMNVETVSDPHLTYDIPFSRVRCPPNGPERCHRLVGAINRPGACTAFAFRRIPGRLAQRGVPFEWNCCEVC